jgi:hypothetical protein
MRGYEGGYSRQGAEQKEQQAGDLRRRSDDHGGNQQYEDWHEEAVWTLKWAK